MLTMLSIASEIKLGNKACNHVYSKPFIKSILPKGMYWWSLSINGMWKDFEMWRFFAGVFRLDRFYVTYHIPRKVLDYIFWKWAIKMVCIIGLYKNNLPLKQNTRIPNIILKYFNLLHSHIKFFVHVIFWGRPKTYLFPLVICFVSWWWEM